MAFWNRLSDWSERRVALSLFLSLWLTYAFIGPGSSAAMANTIPRMALAYQMLMHQTLVIDPFASLLIDKAQIGGHYYLDKAPGLSFIALPWVWAFQLLLRVFHVSTAPIMAGTFTPAYLATTWVACIMSSALFTALAAVALYRLGRHFAASRTGSLFGALSFGLATPAAGWATVFISHAVAGAFLFIAFTIVVIVADRDGSPRRDIIGGFLVGGLLIGTIVVEFTGAIAVLLLGVFAIWRVLKLPGMRAKRLIGGAVLGAFLAALPLLIYDATAFGSPFRIGYQNVVGFAGMQQGIMGIGIPSARTLWKILFGQYRGLFWLTPLLLFAPWAFVDSLKRLPFSIFPVIVGIPLIFVLINSGYFYWDGGFSTGPRHITPILPFIAFPLIFLWDSSRWPIRLILMFMAGLSAAICLICASTTMVVGDSYPRPFVQYILPALLQGRVHNAWVFVARGGQESLLLLLAIWAGVVLMIGCMPHYLPRRKG